MRCLQRNLRPFYYALYISTKPLIDDAGYLTGEHEVLYREPVEAFGNISAAKGDASVQPFGNDIQYDRVIVMDEPNTPIDEHAVLYIDRTPDQEPDYEVRKVARSLNTVAIAISRLPYSVTNYNPK